MGIRENECGGSLPQIDRGDLILVADNPEKCYTVKNPVRRQVHDLCGDYNIDFYRRIYD